MACASVYTPSHTDRRAGGFWAATPAINTVIATAAERKTRVGFLLRRRTGTRTTSRQRAQQLRHRFAPRAAASPSAATAATRAAADAQGDIERRAPLLVLHVELGAVLGQIAD